MLGVETPVFALVRRDLLSTMRRWSSWIWVLLLAAVAVAVLLANWPGHQITIQQVAGETQAMFFLIMQVVVLSVAFVIPAVAAGSIAIEKEQKNFDLLKLTLIRPSGFVFGKLLSAVGFMTLLCVAILPVFSTFLFLVGLDLGGMAMSLALAAMMVLSCGTIGILTAMWCRTTHAAIIWSYLATAFFMGGFLLAPAFFIILWDITAPAVTDLFEKTSLSVCPPGTLWSIYADPTGDGWMHFICAAVYHGALALTLCLLSVLLVRRPPRLPLASMTAKRKDRAKKAARSLGGFAEWVKNCVADSPLFRNPMFVRELVWEIARQKWTLFGLFGGYGVVFFCIGLLGSYNPTSEWDMLLWVRMQMWLILVAVPAFAGNIFSKEYERESLDLLRLTLMTPKEVVSGKLRAALIWLVPIVLAAALSSVPAMIVRPEWRQALGALATVFVSAVLAVNLTGLVSFLARSTVKGVVGAYVVNTVLFVVVPIFLYWLLYDVFRIDDELSAQIGYFFSPATAFCCEGGDLTHCYGGGSGELLYWGGCMLTWLTVAWFLRKLITVIYARKAVS